eukprot:GEMP01071162.1.p1 GENE.GEMP01071162.1~~GEMP01071162.1.p1  ORF type:complete len:172 (-),score=33.76 GEMP01071162.1:580-1095(-)
MYRGKLPGLVWNEEKKRYFRPTKECDGANLSPLTTDEPPRAGHVPTAGAVVQSLKSTKRKSDICGVCLEKRWKRVELPCGHAFCRPCVKGWLERKGHCPTCRQVVDLALQAAEKAARSTPVMPRPPSFDAEATLRDAASSSRAAHALIMQGGANAEDAFQSRLPRRRSRSR